MVNGQPVTEKLSKLSLTDMFIKKHFQRNYLTAAAAVLLGAAAIFGAAAAAVLLGAAAATIGGGDAAVLLGGAAAVAIAPVFDNNCHGGMEAKSLLLFRSCWCRCQCHC